VCMKKREEDGIEIAAKGLGDIVALMENNSDLVDEELVESIHPAVREETHAIADAILRKANSWVSL
jgi:hypothetical protein